MAKTNLKDLTVEQLRQKERSLKIFIGVFIPLIFALFFFIIQDYLSGEEFDWSMITIAICTLGGPVTIYPELKEVQEELNTRN